MTSHLLTSYLTGLFVVLLIHLDVNEDDEPLGWTDALVVFGWPFFMLWILVNLLKRRPRSAK